MNTSRTEADHDAILERLDLITAQLGVLADRSQRQQELFDELGPISKQAMALGQRKLGEAEARGYFAFAEAMGGVVDRVVTSYSADDVTQLGDNIVRILDTVRRVTQPDMLAIAEDATRALDHADDVEPRGVLGMLRETRDDDIRRGVAMLLEVLRYVGRGTARVQAAGPSTGNDSPVTDDALAKLRAKLAPKRAAAPAPAATPRPAQAPRAAATPRPTQPPTASAGAAPTGDPTRGEFTFIDDATWNRSYAEKVAQALGVDDFTETHWTVISYARADYAATGKAPNIRRITGGTGVDTRAIYQLFPKAPGLATALCAGIPKPAGCL